MATTRQGLVDRVKRVALRAGTRGARALVETAVATVRTVDALQSKLQRVRGGGRRTGASTPGAHSETLFTGAREQVASVASSGAAVPDERAPSPARTTSGQARTRTSRARAGATTAPARAPGATAGTHGTRTGAGVTGSRSGRVPSPRASAPSSPRGVTPSAAESRRAAVMPRGAIESARPVKTAASRGKTQDLGASRETGRKTVPGQAAAKRVTAKKRQGPLKVKRGQKHRH